MGLFPAGDGSEPRLGEVGSMATKWAHIDKKISAIVKEVFMILLNKLDEPKINGCFYFHYFSGTECEAPPQGDGAGNVHPAQVAATLPAMMWDRQKHNPGASTAAPCKWVSRVTREGETKSRAAFPVQVHSHLGEAGVTSPSGRRVQVTRHDPWQGFLLQQAGKFLCQLFPPLPVGIGVGSRPPSQRATSGTRLRRPVWPR